MRVPIAHCLGLGERLSAGGGRLDLAAVGALTFEPVDEARFPCLALARRALQAGGALPTVLNAANEVAVAAFAAGRISFLEIAAVVTQACEWGMARNWKVPSSIDEALAVDGEVRQRTLEQLARGGRLEPAPGRRTA